MPEENGLHLKMLLQSLQLLAAPYQQQIKTFPDFVHVPDEIALVFDDVYLFVDELFEKDFITIIHKNELKQIDTLLELMSTKKELWTTQKLEEASEWDDLRKLSKIILASFNEKEHFPHLFWMEYIPNDKIDKLHSKDQPAS